MPPAGTVTYRFPDEYEEQTLTFSFSTESVNRNEIVVGYAIASYSGQFLQHRHASLAGLGTSLFTLCYGFKVAH